MSIVVLADTIHAFDQRCRCGTTKLISNMISKGSKCIFFSFWKGINVLVSINQTIKYDMIMQKAQWIDWKIKIQKPFTTLVPDSNKSLLFSY